MTAVLSPAAPATDEAVAAVQAPASAEAATSVPAASSVSILSFVRFDLSEFVYTNSYLL